MSKRFLVPVLLWALVLIVGGVIYLGRMNRPQPSVVQLELEENSRITTTADGRAISATPWKHLSDVDRFKLTNHEGETVDSAVLHGTPYVVSFFFSSCPSFCRDLNKQIRESNQAVRKHDIKFLTVTVDPDVDTVPVLKKYAASFDAKADRWAFLTGSMDDLKKIGENSFNVVVDRDTHTDDILLVDKWGRYRDRFKWSSAADMKRFIKVVAEVCEETEPPLDKVVQTRNVMAGIDPPDLDAIPWLQDFHLKTSTGEPFFSRDLTGDVWIAHFWGNEADGLRTAERIGEASRSMKQTLKLVSLYRKNANDPISSFSYADVFKNAVADCVLAHGPASKIQRVQQEYFGLRPAQIGSAVAVVDRYGGVRELIEVSEDVSADELAAKLDAAIKRYSAEQTPVVE
jgi:protein SCO1/2